MLGKGLDRVEAGSGRDEITWNIRDEHFMAIVRDLVAHISRHYSERPHVVVWAHNSHLGDASATDMARPGPALGATRASHRVCCCEKQRSRHGSNRRRPHLADVQPQGTWSVSRQMQPGDLWGGEQGRRRREINLGQLMRREYGKRVRALRLMLRAAHAVGTVIVFPLLAHGQSMHQASARA